MVIFHKLMLVNICDISQYTGMNKFAKETQQLRRKVLTLIQKGHVADIANRSGLKIRWVYDFSKSQREPGHYKAKAIAEAVEHFSSGASL